MKDQSQAAKAMQCFSVIGQLGVKAVGFISQKHVVFPRSAKHLGPSLPVAYPLSFGLFISHVSSAQIKRLVHAGDGIWIHVSG